MSLTEDTLCIIIPLCVNVSSGWEMWLLAVCMRAWWIRSNLLLSILHVFKMLKSSAGTVIVVRCGPDHLHSVGWIFAAIVCFAFAGYGNTALRTATTHMAF